MRSLPEDGTPEPLIAIVQLPRWPWSDVEAQTAFFLGGEDTDILELAHESAAALPAEVRNVQAWE